MVSKAQTAASRKYEKRNPERTTYNAARRAARGFVKPKPGGKVENAVKGYGAAQYVDDLKDLAFTIRQRLEELK